MTPQLGCEARGQSQVLQVCLGGGWWFHRASLGVDRFVMPKSKAVPACFAEHVLFCTAVTKHRSVTKTKPTGKPNTTGHALLQKGHPISGETSSKSNWDLEQEGTTVHVPLEAWDSWNCSSILGACIYFPK